MKPFNILGLSNMEKEWWLRDIAFFFVFFSSKDLYLFVCQSLSVK